MSIQGLSVSELDPPHLCQASSKYQDDDSKNQELEKYYNTSSLTIGWYHGGYIQSVLNTICD